MSTIDTLIKHYENVRKAVHNEDVEKAKEKLYSFLEIMAKATGNKPETDLDKSKLLCIYEIFYDKYVMLVNNGITNEIRKFLNLPEKHTTEPTKTELKEVTLKEGQDTNNLVSTLRDPEDVPASTLKDPEDIPLSTLRDFVDIPTPSMQEGEDVPQNVEVGDKDKVAPTDKDKAVPADSEKSSATTSTTEASATNSNDAKLTDGNTNFSDSTDNSGNDCNSSSTKDSDILPPTTPKSDDSAPPQTDPKEVIVNGDQVIDVDRPKTFEEFIGQKTAVDRLKKTIQYAEKVYEKCIAKQGGVLLTGPTGLGKTTLMRIIARELKVDYIEINSVTFTEKRKIAEFEAFLKEKSERREAFVIGMDEIHACSNAVQTILLTFLENRAYKKTSNGQEIVWTFPQFTFIGATTDPDLLLEPLKGRFTSGLVLELVDYNKDEWKEIIIRKFRCYQKKHPELTITDVAIDEIASRCRSSVRELNGYMEKICQDAVVSNDFDVTGDTVKKFFKAEGIELYGLNQTDLRILQALYSASKYTLSEVNLCTKVHISVGSFQTDRKPFLLRGGFINPTPRGLTLTLKSLEFLKTRNGEVVTPEEIQIITGNTPTQAADTKTTEDSQPTSAVVDTKTPVEDKQTPPTQSEGNQATPPQSTGNQVPPTQNVDNTQSENITNTSSEGNASNSTTSENVTTGTSSTESPKEVKLSADELSDKLLDLLTGEYAGECVEKGVLCDRLKCSNDTITPIIERLDRETKYINLFAGGVKATFAAYDYLHKPRPSFK